MGVGMVDDLTKSLRGVADHDRCDIRIAAYVEIANCRHGKGLFATRTFTVGEKILRFSGKKISFADAVAKGDRECDPMQIAEATYLDLEPPGVFVNHSCQPNSGVQNFCLVAIQKISCGEEIVYDYSTTMDERSWTMECDCRTPNCRNLIGDFLALPVELMRKYIEKKLVPDFILKKVKDRLLNLASENARSL